MTGRSRLRGAVSQAVEAFHFGPERARRREPPRLASRGTGGAASRPGGPDHEGVPEDLFGLDRRAARASPVLTAADVGDYGSVDFVADPFLHPDRDGQWHLFMEVFNADAAPTAVIGHATSLDGARWTYDRVVLQTDFHLSFPYVFEWHDRYYMLPEQGRPAGEATVRLYEAAPFPHRWTPTAELVEPDHPTNDHVVFRRDGRWWLLVGDSAAGRLYAYHSDRLEADGWQPHAENPVVRDRPDVVRPAGRPLVEADRVVAFFQDCSDQYGDAVRAFAIDELSQTTYRDRELPGSPLLSGIGIRGWNSGRMHHVDPWFTGSGWLVAVDGDIGVGRRYTGERWSIGVLQVGGQRD